MQYLSFHLSKSTLPHASLVVLLALNAERSVSALEGQFPLVAWS